MTNKERLVIKSATLAYLNKSTTAVTNRYYFENYLDLQIDIDNLDLADITVTGFSKDRLELIIYITKLVVADILKDNPEFSGTENNVLMLMATTVYSILFNGMAVTEKFLESMLKHNVEHYEAMLAGGNVYAFD